VGVDVDGDRRADGVEGNGYTNWSAGAGLSVTVGRRASIEAQYFIAGDEFENGVVLPPGLSHERPPAPGAARRLLIARPAGRAMRKREIAALKIAAAG
jgi:hypothetical protein